MKNPYRNPYSLVNFRSFFPSCAIWTLFISPLLFLIYYQQIQATPSVSIIRIIYHYLGSIIYIIVICLLLHISKIRKLLLNNNPIAHIKNSTYEFTFPLLGFIFVISYMLWFIYLIDSETPYTTSIYLLIFIFQLLNRNEAILTNDSIFFELNLIPLKDITAYSIVQDKMGHHLQLHTKIKTYVALRSDKIVVDQLRAQLDMLDIHMIEYTPKEEKNRKKKRGK